MRKDRGKYVAILQAAIKVMAEVGYYNAQVSRIAREAGVADGTVYLYFKNKEDILISILRETIGEIIERVNRALEGVADPAEMLYRLVRLYFEGLAETRDLAMVTQVHLRQTNPDVRRQIGDIMKPYYGIIDRIIDRGIEKGLFRPTIDRRIARRMIFGTMDETVTAWVLTGAKYDLVSLAVPVVDLLLGGLVRREEGPWLTGDWERKESIG
ncbi:MAG: TetR/AcrR family transcriptional regulator [Alicyclobacillaceae bacterium]|nr:TetR/AcrR family transcriptional regulator [Alicyclobacillaceae bacterium]